MTISEFLARPFEPRRGAGQESDWLFAANLELVTGNVWIGDPTLAADPAEGMVVTLPRGMYACDVQFMDYGDDRRVSRFRIVVADGGARPTLGRRIGAAWTDTALLGAVDMRFEPSLAQADVQEQLGHELEIAEVFSRIELSDESLELVVVSTGFGDGEYPVFGVDSDAERLGIEVVFIRSGERYPF